MPLNFIFVRHGEAEHNVAFHKDGAIVFTQEEYRDAPLTKNGIDQAKITANSLSSLNVIDIWCSPLTRCIQTAEELFEEINCNTLYLHDTLLERQGGNHVCNIRKSKNAIQKEYPIWNSTFIPEFGPLWVERESNSSVCQRILMLLFYFQGMYKDFAEKDRHLLIVTHHDVIWSLLGRSLKNAEFVILSFDEIMKLQINSEA